MSVVTLSANWKTVLELLGKPDRESASKELVYGLGPDPSFEIDIWDLRVELDENDRVRTTAVDVVLVPRIDRLLAK